MARLLREGYRRRHREKQGRTVYRNGGSDRAAWWLSRNSAARKGQEESCVRQKRPSRGAISKRHPDAGVREEALLLGKGLERLVDERQQALADRLLDEMLEGEGEDHLYTSVEQLPARAA